MATSLMSRSTEPDHHVPGTTGHDPAQSGAVDRVISWLKAKQTEHVTVQQLSALDDRILKDIGISRSQIQDIAHRTTQARGGTTPPNGIQPR